jgi:hypothetical protein
VPSWVVDFVSENPESEFNNRKGKITFASSCLGVKEETGNIKLLRLNDKNDDQDHHYVVVKNMNHATIGAVGNGRGTQTQCVCQVYISSGRAVKTKIGNNFGYIRKIRK